MSDLTDAILSDHARREIARRELSEDQVLAVARAPEAVRTVRPGRVVAQAMVLIGTPAKLYWVRVIVDIDRRPPIIVTACRTSKIEKYRS